MKNGPENKSDNPENTSTSVTETDVRDWLNAHPDFLEKNAELLTGAISPTRTSGEGIVDMQSFLVERLQNQVKELSASQNEFVAAARINMHTQKMILNAVQSILAATSFSHFVHILTQDLPELLEVDVLTLCIEDGPIPLPEMTGLQRLKKGSISRPNWQGGNILMRSDAPKSKAVFGPAMELVQSDALIKLDVPSLHAQAMLAIGSREAGHFDPEQGTDLMSFLAVCIQSCLQMWLENSSR